MQRTNELEQVGKRLTNLEALFTHLERQLAELNLVVLAQSRKLEQAEKQLAQLVSPPADEEFGLDEPG